MEDSDLKAHITEIKTHLKYIREDLNEMKPAVKGHDRDIRGIKVAGGILTALAFCWDWLTGHIR